MRQKYYILPGHATQNAVLQWRVVCPSVRLSVCKVYVIAYALQRLLIYLSSAYLHLFHGVFKRFFCHNYSRQNDY